MEGAPPVANQIDLFMHFLGASRDGLVARRVDLDTISSSDKCAPPGRFIPFVPKILLLCGTK